MSDRSLELQFCPFDEASFVEACRGLVERNRRRIELRPLNALAVAVAEAIGASGLDVTLVARSDGADRPLPERIQALDPDEPPDATLLLESDAERLSSLLLEYLDAASAALVAPITDRHYARKPLFLISIPKGGTHLLYRLVELFGYERGIVADHSVSPGTWYCTEHSNSHTVARDFFVDTVRRSGFGNRLHPFPATPALFIYRNPLDILVSEANYYHREGRTAFFGYFDGMPFEQRLLRLIDDPWLLGSIRDRVGGFLPWLDFPNVASVSFEDLVGPQGGGESNRQTRLIWSLQLKLQVPGCPGEYGERVFDEASPTFHAGRIGGHRDRFSLEAYEKFLALPQDFMNALGYCCEISRRGLFRRKDPTVEAPLFSDRADEFRRRPLRYAEDAFDDRQAALEYNCLGLGYNVVRYRGKYYGVPFGCSLELSELGGRLPDEVIWSPDPMNLRREIIRRISTRDGQSGRDAA